MSRLAFLRDRAVLALIAGAVVAIGMCALAWPVQLDDYDPWGFRIGCGTGFASSYDQATLADEERRSAQSQSGYVDACGSAVLWRRVWSTAMLGLGCGLTVLLVNRRVTDGAQSSIE